MLSFYVKFWTDRNTDRRTPIKQYAPDLLMLGHKNKCSPERYQGSEHLACGD